MTWVKQALVLTTGLVLAAVMVLMGVWQLQVFQAQGAAAALRRASAPPVPLGEVATPGAPVRDGYGRSVRFQGSYLEGFQVLVPLPGAEGRFRVVAPVRLSDGGVLTVVRGVVDTQPAPPLPVEPVQEVGVLLPSEPAAAATAAGQPGSVRIPALAQQWPGPMIDGFVTLSTADAQAHSLTPAPLDLPEARGRLRNGAYAVQWWLFAAFTLAMAVRMSRDFRLLPGSGQDQTGPAGPA